MKYGLIDFQKEAVTAYSKNKYAPVTVLHDFLQNLH